MAHLKTKEFTRLYFAVNSTPPPPPSFEAWLTIPGLILLMFNQCYPIWWNFTILAKIINACGNFLMLYLAYSKILNIFWQILQIFFVVNGQIWKKKFVPSDHTVFNARSCHCAFKGFDRPSLLLPWQLSIVWNKIKKFSEGISKFLTLMKKAEKIV